MQAEAVSFTPALSEDLQIIIMKLFKYLAPAFDLLHDRCVMYSSVQKANEPREQFVVRVRQLAGVFKFCGLEEEQTVRPRSHLLYGKDTAAVRPLN